MVSKATRTKVACTRCKKSKTKCDGEHPCACCLVRGKECIYLSKERRKRGKGLSSSKEEIGQLSKRLEALESVILNLGEKLATASIVWSKAGDETSTTSPPNRSPPVKTPVSSTHSDTTIQPHLEAHKHVRDADVLGAPDKSSEDPACHALKISQNIKRIHQYFNNHSIYAIFSKDSVSWLRNKLTNEPILLPFKNLPMVLDNLIKSSTNLWVSPPSKHSGEIFPRNSALVFEIIDVYYDQLYLANTVCEVQTIRELFQLYYAHNTPEGQFSGSKHKFKASELILMNTTLALCLCSRCPEDKTTNWKNPHLAALSEKELFDMKETFFENAIASYHKISVVNEGIMTIQCLILMVFYVECTYSSDFHVVYMLSSVLVRYAQELGLHRIENLAMLSPKEAKLGRRLWFACEYIDIEICYSSGKPPLINCMDISTLGEDDPDIRSVPLTLFADPKHAPTKSTIARLLASTESEGVTAYYDYFSLFLNRIRRKSYMELFSASAQSATPREILARANRINETMFKVFDLMDPAFKPFTPDATDTGPRKPHHLFRYLSETEHPSFLFCVLSIKLGYLSHMLIINSSPIFRLNLQSSEYHANCELCLQCARLILQLVSKIDRTKVARSIVACLSFYPLVALITLLAYCISVPKNPTVDADSRLIIEVSLAFFAFPNQAIQNWDDPMKFEAKLAVNDLFSRVFAGLLVSFMKKTNGIDYTEEIPGLAKHLDDCKNIYPQLFNRDLDQLDSFRSIFKNPFKGLEPKLSNILDDPSFSNPTVSGSLEGDPLSLALNSWSDSDDNFSSLLYSQIYNLPNMFFDGSDKAFDLAYNDST